MEEFWKALLNGLGDESGIASVVAWFVSFLAVLMLIGILVAP